MFTQLHELSKKIKFTFVIETNDDGKMEVIILFNLKDDEKNEYNIMPLVITGKPEEMDYKVIEAIEEFVSKSTDIVSRIGFVIDNLKKIEKTTVDKTKKSSDKKSTSTSKNTDKKEEEKKEEPKHTTGDLFAESTTQTKTEAKIEAKQLDLEEAVKEAEKENGDKELESDMEQDDNLKYQNDPKVTVFIDAGLKVKDGKVVFSDTLSYDFMTLAKMGDSIHKNMVNRWTTKSIPPKVDETPVPPPPPVEEAPKVENTGVQAPPPPPSMDFDFSSLYEKKEQTNREKFDELVEKAKSNGLNVSELKFIDDKGFLERLETMINAKIG